MEELTDFVRDALKAGASRKEVEKALRSAGWSNEQIADALDHFSEVEFVVPVPRPELQGSARDAFLYLVMFTMLYVSAFNFGALLFDFINLAIPDPLDPLRDGYGSFARSSIRWETSALMVAFPIFMLIAAHINKAVAGDPGRRVSGVRRWLTYLTLAVMAMILLGDVVALIYAWLNGELSLRMILKVLVVALIPSSIFAYYLWSMKEDDEALKR
ncbi:MAG: hypothetical protein GWM88_09310 [Pseudomonadales bacterium]|nr:hypothetical protein [Pseudomonadales bacterium]NIX08194.1 hypothetical protein [Pseudomonadales bacterium]